MRIEGFDHKGRGITRIDNKIVFVKKAIPDEEVDIKIIKSKKKYSEAIITKFFYKSKDRIDYPCPYYLECGGCHIGHLAYEKQLEFKQNKIVNIVNRYLKKEVVINSIIYDKPYHYRNKLTLQVNKTIGLYQPESNDIVEIDNCLLADSTINTKIKCLNRLDLTDIRQFILRVSKQEILLIIVGSKDIDINPIYDYFDNIIIKDDDYYLKKGNNYLLKEINKLYYKVSLDSFFQVNDKVMIKLYNYIKKNCQGSQEVLDLYCGTGSISLYISDSVGKVVGIEINDNAIKDANYNKQINKIDNVMFLCNDTKDIMINQKYDTVIIDPPRSGLNTHIIDEIIKCLPKKIVYVSCDPMTLVRDLNILKKHYHIEEITPFDMFPNTYHVECVCLLKLR